MSRDGIEAWCECNHHASWHPDGGACTYWADRIDSGDIVPVVCANGCKELRLTRIDVYPANPAAPLPKEQP